MDPRELRDYWLLSKEAEGAAKETLRTYREHSEYLLRFIKDEPLTPLNIRRFLADYRSAHSPGSLRTVFISIRAFLRSAAGEGLLEATVLSGLKAPKAVEVPKQIYSRGQLSALFGALEADRTATGLRDHALCSLLLDGGLRASEACALELSDVSDGVLRVGPGKSRRMRTVPLGRRAEKSLARYLVSARPRLGPRCEALLLTRSGDQMNRNTIRLALTRLSGKLGFRLSAHRFRHTFTTMMLRSGCDLETLRRLGGWADYTMLKTYIHLADEDLRITQRRFSALDGL